MKHFLIEYRFKDGSQEEWHQEIAKFIAAFDNDPILKGKISYQCMKSRDGLDYYHLAGAADEQAIKALQSQAFFTEYTKKSKIAAGGELEFVPMEIIAETRHRA